MRQLYILISLTLSLTSGAQTVLEQRTVPFSSYSQSMWGPSSAFNLDTTVSLFRFKPGTISGGTGNGAITTILGQQFGFAFDAALEVDVGSEFKIGGFTLGNIDIDYPIEVDVNMPDSLSFNRGDVITLTSDYSVLPGAGISTLYPQGGRSSLDFIFGFGVDVNAKLCAFGCTDVHILPPVSSPKYLGPWPPIVFSLFSIEQDLTTGSITGTYPCVLFSPCGALPKPPCIPSICTASVFPIPVPDNGLGIGGQLELPNVVTTSTVLGDKSMQATGEHAYTTVNLDLLNFLSNFASKMPPPGPILATFLGNLNNNFSLPFGVSASYSFFTADFVFTNTNKQVFDFKPKIFSKFRFPSKVLYSVVDPVLGDTVATGYDTSVTYQVGHDINFRYPCDYAFMNVIPTYTLTNTFSNHTYDSLGLSFAMSALTFTLTLPRITIIPAFTIWPLCTSIPYPCGCCIDWCHTTVCVPPSPISVPEVGFGPLELTIGPLWSTSIPIGSFGYDWFKGNWTMPGFQPDTQAPFLLKPKPYFAAMTGTNILCKGDSTGIAIAQVTNGTAPYTYNWSGGVMKSGGTTTDTLKNLPAGNHFVTITDANGCQTFSQIVLTEPVAPVEVDYVATYDVLCKGGNSGASKVHIKGGTGGYSFTWSPAVSSSDSASGLVAGNYSYTASDVNLCSITDTLIIGEPDSLLASHAKTDALCFGDSGGSIDLTVTGGTLPYSYFWNDSALMADRDSLPAGNFNVLVTDLNGCTTIENSVIGQPSAPLLATTAVADALCFGGQDGSLTASPTGGTAPYAYSWSNASSILLSSTSNVASGLTTGDYYLQVTDANDCVFRDSLQVGQPTALSHSISGNDVKCYGGSDGSADLSVSGGSIPYSYAWSNSGNQQDQSGLSAGTYSVVITDDHACTSSDTVIIGQPDAPISASHTKADVLCFGGNTGWIDLSTLGGTVPYSFAWSNSSSTEDISSLTAGNYNLLVTDSNACQFPYFVQISQPAAGIGIAISITNVSCFGGSDGIINAVVSGGTAPYQYQWSDSSNTILSSTTGLVQNLHHGMYKLHVIDKNACRDSASPVVSQPAAPLSILLTPADALCYGSQDGSISTATLGGTSPYTFQWSHGPISPNATALFAGTYSVVVTDSKLCTDSAATVIGQPLEPLVASVEGSDVTCHGFSNGIALLTISGGTRPYFCNWSNSDTTRNLYDIPAGTYTVAVTDSHACTANSGIVIRQPDQELSIAIIVDSVNCYGGFDGSIQAIVSGGSPPYELLWGDSTVLLNNNLNRFSIDGLPIGLYRAIAEDSKNCRKEIDITVSQPEIMEFDFTVTNVSCFGFSDGGITTEVSGGIPPYTMSWSDSSAGVDLEAVTAASYFVEIIHGNGCIDKFGPMTITQPEELRLDFIARDVTCRDERNGRIEMSIRGGTAGYSVMWSNGSSMALQENLDAATYTVIVTDDHDCIVSDSVVVGQSQRACLELPNSFTPNADGKNDTWILGKIALYKGATVQVFNTWGLIVFESEGSGEPWDGKQSGRDVPPGTYYYIIDLKDGSQVLTGPVTVVR